MVIRVIVATTTSKSIVSYNGKRSSLLITNNGAATVFISENQGSTLTDGTPIPSAGSLSFIFIRGEEPEAELFGVTSAGTADLRIIEKFGPRQVITGG